MNWTLMGFLAMGLAFGWLSFSHRHRFSEGVSAPEPSAEPLGWRARMGWMTLCMLLWPLFIVTGAAGALLRRR